MKVFVRVQANARSEKVNQIDETHFRVSVHAPAREGKANAAVIESLAGYFSVAKSNVRLVRGEKYKEKIFEIRQ